MTELTMGRRDSSGESSAVDAFRVVIEAAGLRPDHIMADGRLHRCPVEGKPRRKDGAYQLHLDAPVSGWWQNFLSGESETWTAKQERTMTKAERQKLQARIEAARRARAAEEQERHAEARKTAQRIMAEATECAEHLYLERKGVKFCPGLKIGTDGRLVVPVLGEDGKPMSLQFIAEDGGKMFLAGGRMRCGHFPIGGAVGRLCLCEGLATGLSIYTATGQTVWIAFDCGNLELVAAYARKTYPEREIVICADNDHATLGNPGLNKATAAATAIGGYLAVPKFMEPLSVDGKPRTDFNDLHQSEGLDVVREQLLTTSKPEGAVTSASTAVAAHFSIRSDGVYFLEEGADGGVNPAWVCSPLRILASTRNADGAEWGRLVEVLDLEGRTHRWSMSSRLMAGNGDGYRSELLSLGLRIAPGVKGKQRLDLFLSTAQVDGFARCVDRIGWHGKSFVLPDVSYGEQDGGLIVLQGLSNSNSFRQRGTLEEWQESLGRMCIGNSRLVLAVSAALAAPLLELVGMESGGLHLVGGSSVGKTTALRVAGSVCGGGPGGYIKQWRATDNGLEGVAAAHCDTLLCLDEMGQAEPKVVSEVAYMLANGQGKVRAAKDGLAKPPSSWRLIFLSSGETTLADKIAEDGRSRAKAGQTVRVVDIPADAGLGLGLFENLHGCASAEAFARQLQAASVNSYGAALRAFLAALAADREGLISRIQGIVQSFLAANGPQGADGQVLRVCQRFALLAAAGELGISLGVLPWAVGEATRAADACFQAWIEQRGGTGAAELTAGVEQVRRFFQAHGAARFDSLDETDPRVFNRAGYRRRSGDGIEFLVFPEVFRKDVCGGFNDKTVSRELIRLGFLVPELPHFTRKLRDPKGRFYVVKDTILAGEGNNDSEARSAEHRAFGPIESTCCLAGG